MKIPKTDPRALDLLNPEWRIIEDHFGVQMPSYLKQFYSEPDAVLVCKFDLKTPIEVEFGRRVHIEEFTAISKSTIEFFEGFERFIEFASDGGESLYFFDPKEADHPVYLFSMETYDLLPTGLNLKSFLSGKRLPQKFDEE